MDPLFKTPAIDPQERAKLLVAQLFNRNVDKTDDAMITTDEVYVVWFSKTLRNWKALISTTVPDLKYYEVTHNGEKNETYIDTYVKISNIAVADGESLHEF